MRWRGDAARSRGRARFQGIEPTGGTLELEGFDLLEISDGRIQRNDAYTDGATIARQIGLLPPQGSPTEQRMTKAFNAQDALRPAPGRRQGPSRSPTASGSCAAASR